VPEIEWLLEFSADIEAHTLASALDKFETVTGSSLDAFREELERLGIQDDIVTEQAVDRLEFYLQSFTRSPSTVRTTACCSRTRSAAYVGRPVVFYLGLDEDWTHSSPRRPGSTATRITERNIRQFQLLLQNGVDQYYLVQDTAGGTPVTPCLYFEEILDEEFRQFSDLDSIQHSQAARTTHDGFGRNQSMWLLKVTAFSQSSLNTYVNSPRDYFSVGCSKHRTGLLPEKETCSTTSLSSTSHIPTSSGLTTSTKSQR